MTVTVFLGPSLPREEAAKVLRADYRPPVRQGDVYRLVQQDRPSAIAIIDGYFQDVPSVWHKEILWAMDQGIPVFGAASMGALRAAEMEPFGMVGVGRIYEAFRDGVFAPFDDEVFEDDDEVAVVHGPPELGYPALSDAMVDLRASFAAAAELGVIDTDLRDRLVAAYKQRFFRERSFAQLPAVTAELGLPSAESAALVDWLETGRVDQKREDARALLRHLTEGAADRRDAEPAFVFERTTLWAQFVEQSEGAAPVLSTAERAVLEEVRLDPQFYESLHTKALLRLRLHADDPLPVADAAARREALDRLRRRHGLLSREALDRWAAACDLDRAGLNRLLDFEAALQVCRAAAGSDLEAALLDILRSEGRYLRLAARARDKEQRLQPTFETEAAPSALSSQSLLDWYFEGCLGRRVPDDMARYAKDLGFDALKDLLAVLAREKVYQSLLAGEAAVPAPDGDGEESGAA